MKPFEPNLDARKPRPNTSLLLANLDSYNDYFSMGKTMARGLLSGLLEGEEGGGFKDEEKLQTQKFAALQKDNQIVLDETGLSLEPVDAPFRIFGVPRVSEKEMKERVQNFSEETGISQEDLADADSYEAKRAGKFIDDLQEEASAPTQLKEMRLNISDARKFLAYLNSLKGVITPVEVEAIKKIASILTRQFNWQYDVSNAEDDRFMNLIGSLEKIVVAYEVLGLTSDVAELRELLDASRSRYLQEFLMVKRTHYLLPHDEGFGPAKWHTDCTENRYNSMWNEAIETYQKTLKNSHAATLSASLRKHLLEAIDIAEREIKSKPEKLSYTEKSFPEFLKTLERAKSELTR